MNLECFRRQLEERLWSKMNELTLISEIPGTNSPRIQHIVNTAVSCLEGTNEAYFEVGCLNGSSLDAASRNNDNVIKYACDATIFGQMPRLIKEVPNLTFHQGDFFSLDLDRFLKNKVAIYYYDADHTYQRTLDAMEKIVPYLADKALIFMDDLEYGSVYNAWRKFIREHSSQFTIVNEFWTPDRFVACTKGYKKGFWDAFAIAEFERQFTAEDENIANEAVQIWHGIGKHNGRQGTIWPREFKHIHGKEEQR